MCIRSMFYFKCDLQASQRADNGVSKGKEAEAEENMVSVSTDKPSLYKAGKASHLITAQLVLSLRQSSQEM